jgi:hypothetical protein
LYHHLIDNTTAAQTKARASNQLEGLEIAGIASKSKISEILSGVIKSCDCHLFRGEDSSTPKTAKNRPPREKRNVEIPGIRKVSLP